MAYSVRYSEIDDYAMDEEKAEREFHKHARKAKKIISEPDKVDKILQKAEKKIQKIPHVGDRLSSIPTMVEMAKDFFKKEYTQVPLGTIIGLVGVILYFVAPVDAIPDCIPGFGYLDDAAVCAYALKSMQTDIDDYREWRKRHGKEIIDFEED